MKKFILLILLIGVNCNCGVTCSPHPKGPSNSYTETCGGICYDSNSKTLTAICNDADGNPNNTTLITEASATNINNCNGYLCNSQCGGNNQCPAIVPQQQQQQSAALQKQLAALQKQLAATTSKDYKDYLKKIELNLQILQLNCQTNQSSCLSNLQTTFTKIQSLLPNPVPRNLQSFAKYVNRLQTIYNPKPISNQNSSPISNRNSFPISNRNSFQSFDRNSFQSLDQMSINLDINSLLGWAQQLQRATYRR